METQQLQQYVYVGLIGKNETQQYLLCDLEKDILNDENVIYNIVKLINVINKTHGVHDDITVLFYNQKSDSSQYLIYTDKQYTNTKTLQTEWHSLRSILMSPKQQSIVYRIDLKTMQFSLKVTELPKESSEQLLDWLAQNNKIIGVKYDPTN